jgi:phage terminase large subunit GpA-like protein
VPISAAGQRWSSLDAIFIRKIMEEVADEGVNEVTCMCSAQSAKTLTLLCLVAWIICEDPGPILWVTKNVEEAKKLAKSRLMPLLERCAPVAERMVGMDRSQKTTREIYFPGAPLIIAGAESTAALQSTPFRWVILDEARSYPSGALEMVSKRLRSYTHNWKKIIISTPDKEGDGVHRAFMAGDQQRWHVTCPGCGDSHELAWGDHTSKGGLKWEKNEETFDAEREVYRFEELDKTVRYHCWNKECDHVWNDTDTDRKSLSTQGQWVAGNLNAPSNVKSHTWSALLPWWVTRTIQVREFLNSKKALEWADFAPLKDHINETRGEPWSDKLRFANDENYLTQREEDYDPLVLWEKEARRIMTVDVQGKGSRHFYYVIRSWAALGRSRLLAHGVAYSWEELRSKSQEWAVSPDNVAIDSGAWAPEVYEQVVSSGYRWKALKADDKDHFRIQGKAWLFQKSPADPAIGTSLAGKVRPIELYVWAKYGVTERLYAFLHGALGDWRIYVGAADEYKMQVTTWDRRSRIGRNGVETLEWYQKRKEDHYADCEQMQVVAAAATGMLHMPDEGELSLD